MSSGMLALINGKITIPIIVTINVIIIPIIVTILTFPLGLRAKRVAANQSNGRVSNKCICEDKYSEGRPTCNTISKGRRKLDPHV